METAPYKRRSRKKGDRAQRIKARKRAHFRTTRFGGYEETQVICCLWELLKSMEAVEAGAVKLPVLIKQLRSQTRVELRRHFARKKRRIVAMVRWGLLLAGSAIMLFGFVIGVDRVSGNSMYPYLNNGDWIVYSRVGGGLQMDEVVVFRRNGENYVKRIAGLPGDTVEISKSGSRVVVNGMQMRESYVTLADPVVGDESTGDRDPMGEPLTIMEGQYLVLGDNRSVSIDSRSRDMGTVPEDEILGRVVLVARAKTVTWEENK